MAAGSEEPFPYLDQFSRITFPPPEDGTDEGIVAAGGNLSPGMLLSAYTQGVFPWYSPEDPILWWNPDPRFVLFPKEYHSSKRTRRIARQGRFSVTYDRAFQQVITLCGQVPRPGQDGTWVTREMIDGYVALHRLGYAHSVEVWEDGFLAGGLYGVSLGSLFFGESMFSRRSNASKVGFYTLMMDLVDDAFSLVDSQVHTLHMEKMGARNIPRSRYLELLNRGLEEKGRTGDWGEYFSKGQVPDDRNTGSNERGDSSLSGGNA